MQETLKENKLGLYEGMFILSAALSEEARKAVWQKIQDLITSRGGSIEKVHEQGRRRLAYVIQQHREGYYYLVYFRLPKAAVRDLWRQLHLEEQLVRFMTLKAEQVLEKLEFKSLVAE